MNCRGPQRLIRRQAGAHQVGELWWTDQPGTVNATGASVPSIR
jgi:hypothetical protein